MRTITKLQIKRAIILEDARRVRRGEKPINNIRRLAVELSNKYPKKYVADNLDDWLYHAHSKGIKLKCRTYIMNEIITDLCDLLNINREELIIEIEL